MLPRLPLFPLPVVFFPATTLSLHFFELRARDMLADCLDGDCRFGLTPPGDSGEGGAYTGLTAGP